MRDMSKESGDFPLGIIRGTILAKLRIRANSIKEGITRVEVPPGATPISLTDNPIEEILRHNIRDRNTTSGRIARACLAPSPTEVIPRPAIPILAATQTRVAAAVLGQHEGREGSGEDPNKKDCHKLDSHIKRRM